MFRSVILIMMVLFTQTCAFAKSVVLTPELVNAWISSVNPNADKRIGRAVIKASADHGVSPVVIVAVMAVESRFVVSARSNEGAIGLMQVVPRWHRSRIAGRNIKDISTNIDVGASVLKICAQKNGATMERILTCYTGGYGNWYNNKVNGHAKSFMQYLYNS